jgi:hypothetical protein
VTVRLDTAAGVDLGAERRRLEKDLARAIDAAQRKLSARVRRTGSGGVVASRDRRPPRAEITRLDDRLAALPPAD